jgi:Domain of unknown function (DUF222)
MGGDQVAGPDLEADQEAFLAAELESREQEETRRRAAAASQASRAGETAERLPAGPGLAAWLSRQEPDQLTDWDLPAMAGAFRKVVSWAQAGELAMVTRIAARSAGRDDRIGLADDGRPAQVSADAAAQVSLALTLSPYGGEAWTQLAVTLQWRLARTGAALVSGAIDLYRARVIAEATAPLSEAAAHAVEDAIVDRAGDLTYGQLHAAVRRAVIAADPEGAEHRRQAAERRAKVSLYPGQDGTATLIGMCLPAPEAAAAYARVCAVARAMKAAGAGGGIHFLRAQALLGFLNQTLPPIPPSAGGPPDAEPPPDDADDGWSPGRAGEPPSDGHGPTGHGPPRGGGGKGGGGGEPAGGGRGTHRDRTPGPRPASETDRPGHGSAPEPEPAPPEPAPPGSPLAGPAPAADPWPRVPPLTDADLPADDGCRDTAPPLPGGYADWDPARGDPLDDHFAGPGIQWPWPSIPLTLPGRAPAPGCGPPDGTNGRPPAGLLDLTLSWTTFTGQGSTPGTLGRIGPITGPEASRLASLALAMPGTEWRIILTNPDQHAIAVARIPRSRRPARRGQPGRVSPGGEPRGPDPHRPDPHRPDPAWPDPAWPEPGGPAPAGGVATVGRVTVLMPASALDTARRPRVAGSMYARILATATRARDRARDQAEGDGQAPGGCAHAMAVAGYRPPGRLRELVAARDQTCRNPRCGQPAGRGDLDHTLAYDRGGRTCPCNLGGLCRRHHRLKQLRGWDLAQPEPGIFRWTTPAGRSYDIHPDPYPA